MLDTATAFFPAVLDVAVADGDAVADGNEVVAVVEILVHPDVALLGTVALEDRVKSAHWQRCESRDPVVDQNTPLTWYKVPSPPSKTIWMVTFAPS